MPQKTRSSIAGDSNNNRLAQPRMTMGPVVLNYDFKNNMARNEVEIAGIPTVLGYNSTEGKEALPGQWTLVKEINMEKREPPSAWRGLTSQTMQHMSRCLKESLLEYPHPKLSEKALGAIKNMRK